MALSRLKHAASARRGIIVGGAAVVALLGALLAANGAAWRGRPAAIAANLQTLEQRSFPATDPRTLKLSAYRGAKLVLFFYEMAG